MAEHSPPDRSQLPTRTRRTQEQQAININQAISALEPRWLMPIVDMLLILVAFGLAYYVRYELQLIRPVFEANIASFQPYLPYVAVFWIWAYINYRGARLYLMIRGRPWLEEVYIIVNGATNATVVVMALSFILQPIVFSRLMMVYAAAFTVILLAVARVVRRTVHANLRSKGLGVQRVLLIGVGDVGQAVLRTMIARKELGYVPVGYLDDNPERGSVDLGRLRGLGNTDNILDVIHQNQVDLVVVTLKWEHHERIIELVRASQKAGVEVRVVPDFLQMNMRQVQVENLDGIPLLGVSGSEQFIGSNRFFKRAIDLLLITLCLPILIPLFGIIALAIRLDNKGPIFYKQRRVGENERPFHMVKFRTMIPNADKQQEKLVKEHNLDARHPKIPDDPRITRVGRFLRRTSLDELPNLINVVRGEMSLVGPRPPTPDEVDLYDTWHKRRLNIMPGITGLWQISGRSHVPFDEMCLLDIYYIENWSVKLDIQILLMTLPRVLLRHGAY